MNEIAVFYVLKVKVLETYKETHPFFQGSIHDFGNKEIAQFQELIENKLNERVSEKWVYTHLKPKINEKIPRKDMLDILCKFSDFKDWDEFFYKNSEIKKPTIESENYKQNKTKYYIMGGIFITAIGLFLGINQYTKTETKTICFKDKYTQKIIESDKFEVYDIDTNIDLANAKTKLKTTNGCLKIKLTKQKTLRIESPYYKKQLFILNANDSIQEINLQPDDYAMMIRSCMNSNLKDWNKRKIQLENCIDENAEIEEVMFDEIGVDFLNKQDFISKITTPSEALKKMEIIDIKYLNDKIISLKFIQK